MYDILSRLFSNCSKPIINPATIQPKVPKNLITGNVFPESEILAKSGNQRIKELEGFGN